MSKIDISTRVIAVCDNLLMLTNDKEVTLATGFEEKAFIVDKNTGEQITDELSIDFLLRAEEDLEWKPVEEYYSDVYQNKDTYNDSLEQSSLLGFALGDAFGVPYEFLKKEQIRQLELDGMIGNDTNMKFKSRWSDLIPSGAWSDDTSMIYSTMDAIVVNDGAIDNNKIMQSFVDWWEKGKYCSINVPFGLGNTVAQALGCFVNGKEPLECGGKSIRSNGNGALMRILPFSLYCIRRDLTESETAIVTSDASALTHGHDISKMGCFIFTEFMRGLYETRNPEMSFKKILGIDYYKYFSDEAVKAYSRLLDKDFKNTKDEEMNGSGYVVDSLECAIYSVLNTNNFEDAIKMAVNTGYDTDTIAGITGALAGTLYGVEKLPEKWVSKLRKKEELDLIALKYSIILDRVKKNDLDDMFVDIEEDDLDFIYKK